MGAGERWGGDLMEAITEKRRIKRGQAKDWILEAGLESWCCH